MTSKIGNRVESKVVEEGGQHGPAAAKHLILCLDSGSSSLKFSLYRLGKAVDVRIARGAVERIGLSGGRLRIRGINDGLLADVRQDFPTHTAAAAGIAAAVKDLGFARPDAAGHRVVHGGPTRTTSERVDAPLLAELRKLIPFAPLHLPSAVLGIEAVASKFPGVPQVACFDTAFHRRMPEVAQRFPLPRNLWLEGIRRYGFHGLSFEYIITSIGAAANGRLIIAHLGNAASLTAVRSGEPLDTTMGFTPAGGLMMGTRSGDLDPGILIHLLHTKHMDAAQLNALVNERAGLLGVSGISSDMKTLLEQREFEPHAAQAVELFCYQVRKQIGALTAVLGGLDTLVFTAGIGEHGAPVRAEVCRGLDYLGIVLDPTRNAAHSRIISAPGSSCTVMVIPTNEDLMIARQTRTLLFSAVPH
jgi:acetate kinase